MSSCSEKPRYTLRSKNIRLPKPMMDEVEAFVERHPELYVNRQQFVESAVRDKLTYFRELKL